MAETALNLFRHAFAHPQALALLLLVPLLGLAGFFARRRRRRILARLGRVPALAALTEGGRQWYTLRGMCLTTGLTFLVMGIAGPQWGREPQPTAAALGRDLIVLLDLSRSMLADDVPPHRLGRAREALAELVDTVQRRGGHRLALVAFAARAHVVCPLTHDYDHFREKLRELDAVYLPRELRPGPGGAASGTRFGAGLRKAVEAHDPRYLAQQDILMISDGDDPALSDEEWREGIDAARRAGIPVYTVGIGDAAKGAAVPDNAGQPLMYEGQMIVSRLQGKPLQEIAQRTGGTYTAAGTAPPQLDKLFRERIESREGRDLEEAMLPQHHPRYAWFFAAALGFLALEMAIGRGRKRDRETTTRQGNKETRKAVALAPSLVVCLLPSLLLVSAAPAGDTAEMVRQGNAAFEREDYQAAVKFYEQAEALITDPGLVAFNKATALYHLEQFRDAELHYRRCLSDALGPRRARVLYNLANCLLRESKGSDATMLREAVGFYRECVREDGADDELRTKARHNLELAKLLWRKAPPERQQRDDDRGEEPKKEPGSEPAREEPKPGTSSTQTAATPDERGKPEKATTTPNETPIPTSQEQPGKGNLPPVPDDDRPVKMNAEDTAAHLQQAALRILQERRTFQQSAATKAPRSAMDW